MLFYNVGYSQVNIIKHLLTYYYSLFNLLSRYKAKSLELKKVGKTSQCHKVCFVTAAHMSAMNSHLL